MSSKNTIVLDARTKCNGTQTGFTTCKAGKEQNALPELKASRPSAAREIQTANPSSLRALIARNAVKCIVTDVTFKAAVLAT